MKALAQHQKQRNTATHTQPSAPVFQTFSAVAEQDVESSPASRMSASALFGSYLQRQAMNARFDSNLHANHANPSSLMGRSQPVQRRMAAYHENQEALGSAELNTPRINNTGLPDNLKAGIEGLSGYSMDDVNVHYNSTKPAQLYAHAYTLGNDIHIAPGQEQYLPHEAWHVVQQKQGRVRPTMQLKGVGINDNVGLEREASVMGARALQGGMLGNGEQVLVQQTPRPAVQRVLYVPLDEFNELEHIFIKGSFGGELSACFLLFSPFIEDVKSYIAYAKDDDVYIEETKKNTFDLKNMGYVGFWSWNISKAIKKNR